MPTVEELITQARSDLDDPEMPGSGDSSDSLWSNDELAGYLDRAQKEACKRIDLLPDNTTPALVDIPLVVAQAVYDISPLISRVTWAKVVSESKELCIVTQEEMDGIDFKWATRSGTPKYLILDLLNLKATATPIPTVVGAIKLRVFRYPLLDLTWALRANSPEIRSTLHYDMLDYALFLAYSKRDTEAMDENEAMKYLVKFERVFGPPERAHQAQQRFRRMPLRSTPGF